ncbi:MAG: hypothetical protein H6707_08330 [Deltaproteobacteria bacterium]|nr:hypothetical protein [Deltaproteobacteria bacterium]
MSRRLSAKLAGLAVLLVWIGCGGGTPQSYTDGGTDGTINPDGYRLSIVGSSALTVRQGRQVSLQVSYTKNGAPLAQQEISFSVLGDAKGSSLSAWSVLTDGSGRGTTSLVAGTVNTTFTIRAQAAHAQAVTWTIQVVEESLTGKNIPVGVFKMHSHFDVTGKFQGSTLGGIISVLNEISDDPEDPGAYLADLMMDKIFKDPTLKLVIDATLKPVIVLEINNLFRSDLPQVLKQLAQEISAITHRFQILSDFNSASKQPADQPMSVKHTIRKMGWDIGGTPAFYDFPALGMSEPVIDGVTLTPQRDGTFAVSEHSFEINFGAFLNAAIGQIVLARVAKMLPPKSGTPPGTTRPGGNGDPVRPHPNNVKSLTDFVNLYVYCPDVADKLVKNKDNTVAYTSWRAACNLLTSALTVLLQAQIDKINAADKTQIKIFGRGKMFDLEGNDGIVDVIKEGIWEGTMTIDQATAPLSGPNNTFEGQLSGLSRQ